MFFTISLYTALAIFLLGLLYQGSTWFRYGLQPQEKAFRPAQRVLTAFRGILATLFSPKILTLFKVFVLEVVLQTRILKESRLRWWTHQLIFGGFMGLLLMHGLDKIITLSLFKDYAPTLNPFLFLRDLFGGMLFVGIGLAVTRRFIIKIPRRQNAAPDVLALLILGLILVSGFMLEGLKITSYTRYQEMVSEYAGSQDQGALKALEALWVKDYGLVSPRPSGALDEETVKKGRVLHESCLSCHSRPQWAVLSFGTAKILGPMARPLDRAGWPRLLWTLHFLACFVGLAYLPFSKMMHLFTGPLSLLANAVMDRRTSDPANWATKQMMELSACTHCGACTQRCSVGVAYEAIPNINILPSEKIGSLKAWAAGEKCAPRDLRTLQEGLTLCTNCLRCTGVCPVGINLQELWFTAREALLQKGTPEPLLLSPLSLGRGLMRISQEPEHYQTPIDLSRTLVFNAFKKTNPEDPLTGTNREQTVTDGLRQSVQGRTFSFCYNCKTCTSACPVMDHYDHPQEALGLVPHQIMQALAWGFTDLALGSKMLWVCLGCYQCQEQCPQGVRVTDVFYQLKNLAIKQVKGEILTREG